MGETFLTLSPDLGKASNLGELTSILLEYIKQIGPDAELWWGEDWAGDILLDRGLVLSKDGKDYLIRFKNKQ